jgi:NADPH:quinone reductase-like Zn-dependent oxidoreductase
MRAVLQTGYDGPSSCRVGDVAVPVPAAGEVLLRVRACALNQLDLLQARGAAMLPGMTLPHVAGMDVAGEVVAVGEAVDAVAHVAVGARVVVDPASPCGDCPSCRSGRSGYCARPRIVGGNVDGGLAEHVVVPAASLHPVPDEVDLTTAACLPTPWATAWRALVSVGRVQPAETVLVHAGASSVSLAAVQIAASRGARVIAVVGSDDKVEVLRKLGVDDVAVGAEAGAFLLADRTDGHGADLVLDHVGADTWPASLAALRPEGRLVFLGNTTGDSVTLSLADAFRRGLRLLGSGAYSAQDMHDALACFWTTGAVAPVAVRLPLDRIQDGYELLARRSTVGRVVMVP